MESRTPLPVPEASDVERNPEDADDGGSAARENPAAMRVENPEDKCSSEGDFASEHLSDAELGSDSLDTEDDEEADDDDEDLNDDEVVKDEILLLADVGESEPAGREVRPPAEVTPPEAPAPPAGDAEEEASSPVQSPCFHSGGSYPDQNLPPKTGIAIPMLANTPNFIRSVPEQPELLYQAPDTLFDDIVKAEADRISKPESVLNRTVYDSVGDPGQQEASNVVAAVPPGGFATLDGLDARAQGSRPPELTGVVQHLPPYYTPEGPDDRTLVFESRFESGNLRRAVQVYEFEYDLILNPDYNTKSHTQWYLFRVSNTRRGPQYRFNILNMVKPTSVYNEGMRPLRYSCIDAAMKGVGWVRSGEKIAYYQNGLRRVKGSNYYTLTFTVTFQHDCDEVYFSHCYPYTYTDLQMDLRALDKDPNMARRFRRRKLCETLAGNACDLITITSFCSDPAALKARRAVVITARVHPGESNASWVMKGILDYLTGASVDARILRDNFVFKIVPMLNPDGVIVGNYRCSLAGQDLNRLWDEPSRKMHPTIFFTKSMFRHLLDDREVILFVDIHGHSRKKNVFMYGNSETGGLREKIFPGLLCRSSDCFSFDDCCFKIQRSKESTARVVAYREIGCVNAFTLEASFCGADFGPLGDQHFTTRHLEEMGYMVCDAILDFCDPDQTKVMLVCKELQVLFPDDGNSDDVSDSEDDGAAAARRKKRAARKAAQKREREKTVTVKKKKAAKSSSNLEDKEADEEKKPSKEKEPKTARNRSTRSKAHRREPAASTEQATEDGGEKIPEASDGEPAAGDAKLSRKKGPKKQTKKANGTKSKGSVTSRDKDTKDAKEPKDAKDSKAIKADSADAEIQGMVEVPTAANTVPSSSAGSAGSRSRPSTERDSVPLPLDIAASSAGIAGPSSVQEPVSPKPGGYTWKDGALPAPYPQLG